MFWATNMLSCCKMSEFKAHPVKALLRVWVYLLILANPVQRSWTANTEGAWFTLQPGELNWGKLPDKS